MAGANAYIGEELEAFTHAVNWKRYFCAQIRAFVRGRVLEVGAGIGGTTRLMCRGDEESWTCLEPDLRLAETLRRSLAQTPLSVPHSVVVGTTADVPDRGSYDSIMYIDVIEHIEDDAEELERAVDLLAPSGAIVVLSPAHQWLFTEFDEAIGHHRRYNRGLIQRITPAQTDLVLCRYLDSVGIFASLGNKICLRSSKPTLWQIRSWDRLAVRLSHIVDPLVLYRIGKSILAVWRKWDTAKLGVGRGETAAAPSPIDVGAVLKR